MKLPAKDVPMIRSFTRFAGLLKHHYSGTSPGGGFFVGPRVGSMVSQLMAMSFWEDEALNGFHGYPVFRKTKLGKDVIDVLSTHSLMKVVNACKYFVSVLHFFHCLDGRGQMNERNV